LDLITLMQMQTNTYGTLLTYLDMAGLTETVATSQSTTMIAPNNDAFAALPADVTDYLTHNVDALKEVLLYHFLPKIVNPLMYPLGEAVDVASSQGSNVTVVVDQAADNSALTSFNGVSSIGNIFLYKYGILFQVPTVLLPPDFYAAPITAPVPTISTSLAPVAVAVPTPISRPSNIPVAEPTLRPTTAPPSVAPTASMTTIAASGKTILDNISSNSDATVFLTILNNAKALNRVANDSNQTVFVPIDSAFQAIGSQYLQTLFTSQYLLHLQSLVANHITRQGTLRTLEDGTILELSGGEQAFVHVDNTGSVSITTIAASSGLTGKVSVRSPPVLASNGALYVTNDVLAPIWYYHTIIDVLSQGDRYTTLLSLIDLAGLKETIASSISTTMLAPNNAAFAALPNVTLSHLTDAANVVDLKSVLLYHFLPIVVNPLDFPVNTNVDLTTSQGSNITLRIERGASNLAITTFNGFSQIGFIALSKFGARIQLDEVLVPPGLTLPGI
jgi:uncharacterized surface protein with fasciclin (FAS1) repeats